MCIRRGMRRSNESGIAKITKECEGDVVGTTVTHGTPISVCLGASGVSPNIKCSRLVVGRSGSYLQCLRLPRLGRWQVTGSTSLQVEIALFAAQHFI